MEDLIELYEKAESYPLQLEELTQVNKQKAVLHL